MRTSSTGSAGFTLVELMVVAVLVAAFATMIVPRLMGATSSAQLRESAQRLLVSARTGRDFAATRRCACRLVVDATEGRYALSYQDDPQHQPGQFVPLPTGVGRGESLPPGLRFARVWVEPRGRRDGLAAQDGAITFDPTGQADAAIVQIADSRRTVSLMISPASGYARLVSQAVDVLPNDRRDLDE